MDKWSLRDMTKIDKYSFLRDYAFIIIGCFFMASALSIFLEPHNIVIGGVTGLAVIVASISERLFGFAIPLWFTNLVINIPLFLIGFKVYGFRFLKRTLFSTLFLSFALFITDFIPPIDSDLTIAVLFGGALTGFGLGLIFRSKATTGGSDMAGSLLNKYFRHISVAKLMLIIDVIIITAGFFEFGTTPTLYAIVCVFIISKVVDAVLEGLDFAKAAFIISNKNDKIAEAISDRLGRGITFLYGEGAYTKEKKNIILCAVSKKEVHVLKDIAKQIDSSAFIMVADIREILGEGFKEEE